jgi:hydroxymethylpyrimidine/phosphomethylpyrimidine kinase
MAEEIILWAGRGNTPRGTEKKINKILLLKEIISMYQQQLTEVYNKYNEVKENTTEKNKEILTKMMLENINTIKANQQELDELTGKRKVPTKEELEEQQIYYPKLEDKVCSWCLTEGHTSKLCLKKKEGKYREYKKSYIHF